LQQRVALARANRDTAASRLHAADAEVQRQVDAITAARHYLENVRRRLSDARDDVRRRES
jgi:hypothetical protein